MKILQDVSTKIVATYLNTSIPQYSVQIDKITAFGHPNIVANHKTTLEFTKEKHLSPKGDCIVGINANKSIKEIAFEFGFHSFDHIARFFRNEKGITPTQYRSKYC